MTITTPVQSITEVLYTLSDALANASTPTEIMDAASAYARSQGASSLVLFYFDFHTSESPDWIEAVAIESANTRGSAMPVGTRFYLPDFPSFQAWVKSPDQPLIISNINSSPDIDENSRQSTLKLGVLAQVVLPFNVHNQWTGLLVMNWSIPHEFNDEDRRLYKAISQQVGWRIDSVRKTAQLQQRYESAESNARTSQERLQLLIRNAPVVMFAIDRGGIFTFSDGKGLAALGLEPGQVVGMNAFDLYSGAPEVVAALQRALTGDEFQVNTRVGDEVYQNWYSPVLAADGRIEGAIGVAVNITLQYKAEQAAQNMQQQLQVVVRNTPIVLYALDQDGLFTLMEGKALEDVHIKANQYNGLSAFEIYKPVPQLIADIQRALKGEAFASTLESGDVSFRTQYVPIRDESDAITGMIGLSVNVTDQVRDQKERERLIRQLRETARFKDEFLAVMSHELRTPLNAMIGLLGIALMGSKLTERDTMLVTRARANSERLLTLINNILDISRMEAGRFEIVPGEVAVRPLIERLHTNMSILAEQKTLKFTATVAPTLPETLQVDEDAITKIVTNLVANALKFTEQGSVTLRVDAAGDDLILEVKDTGIGIPVHMREVIFESFRQVDASSTRVYGGSGLGLSIVRNLCNAMHGTVRVDSLPGMGSTFTVTLPLRLSHPIEPVTEEIR